jgi:hypothetical protein
MLFIYPVFIYLFYLFSIYLFIHLGSGHKILPGYYLQLLNLTIIIF